MSISPETTAKIVERVSKRPKSSDPLVYIELMKFARRCEGVDQARKVFMQARKVCKTYHCFVAAAMMEYHQNSNQKIASKIFSYGLQSFLHESEYVLQYLDFLGAINDHKNMTAVFEKVFSAAAAIKRKEEEDKHVLDFERGGIKKKRGRTVGAHGKTAAQIAPPVLWERYVELQRRIGDLRSVDAAEKRKEENAPTHLTSLQVLIDRCCFLDVSPLSAAHSTCLKKAAEMAKDAPVGRNIDRKVRRSLRGLTPIEAKRMKQRFPRPALAKMVQYRPGMEVEGAMVIVKQSFKGHMLPRSLAFLLSSLPTPYAYRGPMVNPTFLMDNLMNTPTPSPYDNPEGYNMVTVEQTQTIVAEMFGTPEDVVKEGEGTDASASAEDAPAEFQSMLQHDSNRDTHAPPANDVYRRRRRNKLA